jgi:hypothetical protein
MLYTVIENVFISPSGSFADIFLYFFDNLFPEAFRRAGWLIMLFIQVRIDTLLTAG